MPCTYIEIARIYAFYVPRVSLITIDDIDGKFRFIINIRSSMNLFTSIIWLSYIELMIYLYKIILFI